MEACCEALDGILFHIWTRRQAQVSEHDSRSELDASRVAGF